MAYRMLQGHLSRIGWDGQAEGTDPDEISTEIKLVAETPGDTEPKMRYGYHALAITLTDLNIIMLQGLVPGGNAAGDTSVRDAVHLCPAPDACRCDWDMGVGPCRQVVERRRKHVE
eukprot:5591911-Amphidinium_carterae.8